MRPIDFCTPNHSNSNTLTSSLPSAARSIRVRPCDPPRACSRTEPCGSCPFTRKVFFRAPLRPSEDARGRHREARGRPVRTRLGRIAFHGATPTSAFARCAYAVAFSSAARARTPASGTSVASSELVSTGSLSDSHAVARRPPRSVPRGPRERRALPRSEMPSVASCLAQPTAPKRGRPTRPSSIARRSRDVDRLAPKNRPPFTRSSRPRLRARDCLWLSPRSRASYAAQAFDPPGTDHALLWARRRSTDFCNTTMQGH
jgi:hypothetical protein